MKVLSTLVLRFAKFGLLLIDRAWILLLLVGRSQSFASLSSSALAQKFVSARVIICCRRCSARAINTSSHFSSLVRQVREEANNGGLSSLYDPMVLEVGYNYEFNN